MSRKTRWHPSYTHLRLLMASPTAPLPAEQQRHQLTLMHLGLSALERGDAPAPEDWRVLSDAVNLLQALVEMGVAQDASGLLREAIRTLAEAGRRHVDEGKPLRLDGAGIAACRAVLADWQVCLEQLPERTILSAHARAERRVHRMRTGQDVRAGDVVVV